MAAPVTRMSVSLCPHVSSTRVARLQVRIVDSDEGGEWALYEVKQKRGRDGQPRAPRDSDGPASDPRGARRRRRRRRASGSRFSAAPECWQRR